MKTIVTAKKIVVEILVHIFLRIASIQKSIAQTSVFTCEEMISVMDTVSTKMTNTITLNASTNCYTEKVRYKIDCCFLHCFISEMFY